MDNQFEDYLGDGVYVKLEHGMIRLNAGDNIIYLEPEVLQALIQYDQRVRLALSQA